MAEEYDAAIVRLDAETEAKIRGLRKLAGLHAGRYQGRYGIVDPVPPRAVPVRRVAPAVVATIIAAVATVTVLWLVAAIALVIVRLT